MQGNSGGEVSGTRARLQARLNNGGSSAGTSTLQSRSPRQARTQNGDAAMSGSSSRMQVPTMRMANGRMPQAPASLLVQLPPEELKRILEEQQQARGNASITANTSASASLALQNQAAAAAARLGLAGPSSGGTVSSQAQPVGMSDVALLAASLQERREREARVFIWQQRLIGGVTTDRAMLKKALTQLSLPAWLQVLQERHLAHRCAYPTCSRAPKRAHASHNKSSVLAADAPRYRISLRRRTIERDERDDAGGEHAFCGDACWRRGEWVSRWVLNGGASTKRMQRAVSEGDEGLLAAEADGGRWERNIDESFWTEIELLEDLEDRGEVERLKEDPLLSPSFGGTDNATAIYSAPQNDLPPIVTEFELDKTEEEQDDELERTLQQLDEITASNAAQADPTDDPLLALGKDRAKLHEQNKTAGTAENFLSLLDSLEIRERTNGNLAQTANLQSAVEASEANEERHEDDDARAMNDISMPDDESIVAQEQREHAHSDTTPPARREEDDLFDQAWAAMDEEKAHGRWEDE